MFIDTIKLKRLFLRFCWLCQIILFTYGYFFSFQNTKDTKYFLQTISQNEKLLQEKKYRISKLRKRLDLWYSEPWMYEKRARKLLQLGHPDEEHYLID